MTKATANPISAMMDKAVQDALGAKEVEILKLRSIVAVQGAEIQRLRASLAEHAEKEPELPLAKAKEGEHNGAHH